jgi:hypothetical protein
LRDRRYRFNEWSVNMTFLSRRGAGRA